MTWLGNGVVWDSAQGTGQEKELESHFVKGLQGDLKHLNEGNEVLAALQK